MHVIPIKTRILLPPKDDLCAVLDESLPGIRERDVIVITSKVVAIGEGRCIPAGTLTEKKRLVEREADYLARFKETRRSLFSIKSNLIVGSAGIDESNSAGHWTLWPEDPFKSTKALWMHLRQQHGLSRLGVVITDSVSPPMRLGCIGAAIAFFGFHPVERHIGKTDLFGRKFIFSRSNLVDAIAAAAVLTMGETDEQTPLAIVRSVPALRFCSYDTRHELLIRPKQDIYYPILKPIYDASKKSKSKALSPFSKGEKKRELPLHAHRRRLP